MSKSKVFLCSAIFLILGVGFYSFIKIELFYLYIITALSFIVIIVWWKVKRLRIVGFCGLFFVLGIFRLFLASPDDMENKISFYNDKEDIEFTGIITEEADIREDKIKLTVNTESVKQKEEWRNISGKVLVDVERFPEFRYGDELNISCQLLTPKVYEEFSYKDYLAKFDIYSVCYKAEVYLISSNKGNKFKSFLLGVKNKFSEIIGLVLPGESASLLKAILLGAKNNLSDETKELFSLTGTSHIIVISGLHISIIAGLLLYITKILSIPRKYSLIISIAGLILFVLLIGAYPSAIRAGIMGSLVILAIYSGRLSDSKNAILCAAVIIILINPKVLRFDVGFQLSFLATIGIIYLSPYLGKYLKILPNFFKIKEIITMTLAAQILTLPVIIYNFGRFSIVSPVVNLLIVPIVPLIIVLGFISISIGFVWLYLSKLFSVITWFSLQYIIYVVCLFAKIPLASVEVDKLWVGWIVVYYLIIAVFFWHIKSKEKIFSNNYA